MRAQDIGSGCSVRRYVSASIPASMLFGLLMLTPSVVVPAAEEPAPSAEADDSIDFDRARELMRRSRAGETLTREEQQYLQRAREARRNAQRPGRERPGSLEPRETTGLVPLLEMTADDRYEGEDGGLYGGGQNEPPDAHRQAALAAIEEIVPRNPAGEPDDNGRIVFVSISMSNATQEFSRFKRLADADPDKSSRLTIVDCAQGGQAMAEWVEPDARPWQEADRRIAAAGVTPEQVQVAWIKLANKSPRGTLEEHGRKLQQDTQAVIRNARERFPNLKVAYLSSRIYAGYATTPLNPEPYAYESAFVVRWLIQDQIAGSADLNADPAKGESRAPVLLWGPYLWADGTKPRASDQLTYTRDDLARDGTHPSEQGRDKVARLMLDFYRTDPLARRWFTGKE